MKPSLSAQLDSVRDELEGGADILRNLVAHGCVQASVVTATES